jgi:hypothetical protein
MEGPREVVISVIAGSTGTINAPIHWKASGDHPSGPPTPDARHLPVTIRMIGRGRTRALVELIIDGYPLRLAELNGEGEIRISGLTISEALESVSDGAEASIQVQFQHPDAAR